jgi:2',3'-cyclic-nucleotide 2'-phosphodiesterase (5'-nucleotidase family)
MYTASKFNLPFLFLCFGLIISCHQFYHPSKIEHASIQIEQSLQPSADSSIINLIEPFHDSLEHSVKQVIGFASHDLEKERPESTLGNWVADAMLDYAEEITGEDLDLALTNYGGLRINSIPAGPITLEKMYELMPFDNLLVLMDLTGTDLLELFDHVAASGGWPISRGIMFTISAGKATNIILNDHPIDPEAVYKIVINDYVANGGSDSHFLKGKPSRMLNVLMRDALIAVASNSSPNPIESKVENRITLAEANE